MVQLGVTMPTPVVDIAWLRQHLNHPEVCIVDCRFALSDPTSGKQAYQQGHFPGAYYLDLDLDLSGPVQPRGGRHPLPDIEQLVAKLEAMGISTDPATAVVAYDATKGAFAARLWWLLRYLGHEHVSVLEGGFQAWQSASYPLEQAPPSTTRQGRFSPYPNRNWVVDREYVMQHKDTPGTILVDARSPERFRGEQEPIDPIAGSIPGAVNVFWQTNLDDKSNFRQETDLEQLWASVPKADQYIFYCGSGVTACVNILAQEILGRPIPKLYAGGWSDWCTNELS